MIQCLDPLGYSVDIAVMELYATIFVVAHPAHVHLMIMSGANVVVECVFAQSVV